jgi:hypothetical protein
MRAILRGAGLVLAAGAFFSAAPLAGANPFIRPAGKIILLQPSDSRSDSELPTLAPGDEFGVNCGCLGPHDADVRVVLRLAADPGEQPTGYKKLLATDQTVDRDGLHVRVPDVPGLANHTVDVQVYVVDGTSTKACNAGRVRIT